MNVTLTELMNPLREYVNTPVFSARPDGEIKVIDIRCLEQKPGVLRMAIDCNLGETRRDEVSLCLTPAFEPDFHWIGQLTPEEGYVADMHSFRNPAVIMADGIRYVALLPELSLLDSPPARVWLDLDAKHNRMFLGYSDTEVGEHVLYRKKPGAAINGKITIGIHILYGELSEELSPWRPVLRSLWENYGRSAFARELPATLMPYVHHTYQWAFERWKDVVWQKFYLDGVSVGAPTFIVTTTQSPGYNGIKKERETRSIWNQAWFCSLRSASGLYRYARRMGDTGLMAKANATKELALRFPMTEEGLFYSVAATEMERYEADGKTFRRSLGWETHYFGNSDRNPMGDAIRDAQFHLLDMSFTSTFMLIWYEELETDERLTRYASRYADALLKRQDEKGFFPAWIDKNGNASEILHDSPESAMSAVFLLTAARVFHNPDYKAAALKTVNAIRREILPDGRWEDFETYWSCSRFGEDHRGRKFERNNLYKQCNFSMFFTAWALLDAYNATDEEGFLKDGQRVLDEMLMSQASWQPPYMAVPVVGGFSVLNADGEWLDARQSLFAELIYRYGQTLDCEEYRQRAVAALKASFVMMYCPENPEVKKQWEKAWPFLSELDYGFSMENYGHSGRAGSDGSGIGEFTIYDWGCGAASEAVMRIMDRFGTDSEFFNG